MGSTGAFGSGVLRRGRARGLRLSSPSRNGLLGESRTGISFAALDLPLPTVFPGLRIAGRVLGVRGVLGTTRGWGVTGLLTFLAGWRLDGGGDCNPVTVMLRDSLYWVLVMILGDSSGLLVVERVTGPGLAEVEGLLAGGVTPIQNNSSSFASTSRVWLTFLRFPRARRSETIVSDSSPDSWMEEARDPDRLRLWIVLGGVGNEAREALDEVRLSVLDLVVLPSRGGVSLMTTLGIFIVRGS